jgi:hypothetical protein
MEMARESNGVMNAIRTIRFRPRKPAEPPPALVPHEPIVQDETTGMWSVWNDDAPGFPSYAFATAVWLQRQHRELVRQ